VKEDAEFESFYTAKSGTTRLKRRNKKVALCVTVGSQEVFFDVTSFPKDTLRYLAEQIDTLVAFVQAYTTQEHEAGLEDRISKALRRA
jgi:hypothetical protein